MMKNIPGYKKGIFLIAMLMCMAPMFAQQASVQLIHNASDPALDSIDVWVVTFGSPTKFYSNLKFRQQSTFLSLPTGFSATIGIAPAGSTKITDTVYSKTLTLSSPSNYLYMFSGLVNATGFATNPSGRKINVSYASKNEIRSQSKTTGQFDITFINDVTDAYPFKVVVRGLQGQSVLAYSVAYGDTTGYMSLKPGDYFIDLYNATNGKKFGSYELNLKDPYLSGVSSGIIFTSGFMDSTKNKNGRSFGVFMALPVLPNSAQTAFSYRLPQVTNAKIQFVNASTDPAFNKVDVYVFGNKVVTNLSSLSALAYNSAPADTTMFVVVAPGGSSSIADSIFSQKIKFGAGDVKIAVLAGVANATGFAANPQGRSIKGAIYLTDGRMASYTKGKFEAKIFHGVTDAGYYDVFENNGPKLMDNGAYTDFGSYTAITAGPMAIELKDSADAKVQRRFKIDLTGLSDSAGILLMTGFDKPANNKNGANIGLVAVLPHGQVITSTDASSIQPASAGSISMNIYPNPVHGNAMIKYNLQEVSNVKISVLDEAGRILNISSMGEQIGVQQYALSTSKLAAGIYYIQVQAGSNIGYQKLVVY